MNIVICAEQVKEKSVNLIEIFVKNVMIKIMRSLEKNLKDTEKERIIKNEIFGVIDTTIRG